MARRAAVPVQEFRVADANAAYRGVSLDTLMENAGRAVAREARKALKGEDPTIVILCGKGNNGGDGFVAARELAAHARVTVVLAEPPSAMAPKGEAARAFATIAKDRSIIVGEWRALGRAKLWPLLGGADLVLDCLLGSGISGPVRSPYRELIAIVNSTRTPVVSVDVPSGFPFSPAVRPKATITLEGPKLGMTPANSGRIKVVPIGFPPEAWTHTGPGELLLVPQPSEHVDKRGRGVLAVVAGGPYSGAPAIVALAAHAAGVGLVHLYTPSNVADIVRRFDPTLVVHALEGDRLRPDQVPALVEDIADRGCAAVAIGPGLGRAKDTLTAVPMLMDRCDLPSVVDADAIEGVRHATQAARRRALITPHAGEYKRLMGRKAGAADDLPARRRAALAAARRYRTTVLLKGHVTVITEGWHVKYNDAGTPAMAVGGAGDVLTGVIGSLLAKGLEPYDAARAGAFAAGKAGELAFASRGHSLKATDLIDALPRVFARYIPWWGGKP